MDELKMTGNCLKGSRGLVCFDGGWEGGEEWKLLREMLTHVSVKKRFVAIEGCGSFSAIYGDCFDRLSAYRRVRGNSSRSSTTFSPFLCWTTRSGSETSRSVLLYSSFKLHMPNPETSCIKQIVEKDPLQPSGPPVTSLVEIGPRFVLTPIRIFEGSFGGPTIFANPGMFSMPPSFLWMII
jgi:ribosome biogenesis protein BRX1